jgi:predicted nuclease with TOPRIM domain
VIPPEYPYNRPARDSYTFCCCGGTAPPINQYPSAGPFVGSAFMMNDGNPYLMDSTQMTYGAVLTYSESVYTHISKRDDLSCINLAAVFDMTDTSLTNTVRNDFLKQYISRKYMELSGVLPIVKTTLKFRIYYTIRDLYGGTIQQNHCDTNVTDSKFHFTDIRDRYVQSAKGLVIDNIPAITYQGLYNITIDRIELRVGVIDTKEHLVDAMTPFYQFVDNNQHIRLQSDTIKNTPQDSEIVVAECEVNKSFDYQANVTNRLRLTFTAFTSLPIACGDTMGVWNALNEPTDAVITQLRNEVTAMEEEIRLLHEKDQEQDTRIAALEGQVELNKNNIASLTARVTTLESAVASKDAIINSILARLEALESIHHALVHYEAGKQFYMAQLTWRKHGELFQATKDFVANGSFDTDLANGNLVPVQAGEVDMSAIIERIDTVEQTANDADSLATETATTVDNMATSISSLDTRVSGLNDTVLALNNDIDTLSGDVETAQGNITSLEERVTDLEDKDLSKNKVVVKNLNTGEKQYVGSYGAAATILKEDPEGAYKVYPGEGYSQYTISAETFKGATSLKEIEIPSSTYEIGKEAFRASGLTSFSITSNITTVGTDICGYCPDLTTVTIESPNLDLKEGAFESCTNLTTANIIAVNRMRTSCFYKTGLTTVTVPASVSQIDTGIFSSCPNLVSVTIGAATIGDHVVASSSNLETIELLSNVSSVDSNAFQGAPTGVTINIHKVSLSGSPWGAVDPVINWNVPNN